MKSLPESDNALVIRTDYSNQTAWESLRAAIGAPVGGFQAYVELVDDVAYDGITPAQLIELLRDSKYSYAMVADATTLSHPDRPVLVLDLYSDPGAQFRAIPSQIQSVENNLSLGNMDFEEFAESVDEDGIFRGFRDGY